jgi:hypothetical protein
MKTTIKHVPEYDCPLGEGGLVQSHLADEFSQDELYPTKDARVMVHDFIEHCDRTEGLNPNINELIALGATMHNRRMDFYNGMGDDGLADEVGEQVGQLLSGGFDIFGHKRYTSASYQVSSEIDGILWAEVRKHVKDNFDIELTTAESRRLKSIVYRCLSRGYNRMEWYANRHNCHFDYAFSSIKASMESIMPSLTDALENNWNLEGVKMRLYAGKRQIKLIPQWDQNGLENEAYESCGDNESEIRDYIRYRKDEFTTQTIDF